jgi:hypothetical protein
MARKLSVFLVVLLFFMFTPLAWTQSQAVSAQLNGTVRDPSGAVVPGTRVTLSSPEVGFRREFTTGQSGEYRFVSIPPGRYELTAERDGFALSHLPTFILDIGQTTSFDILLQLKGASEVVQVTGIAPVLSVGTPDIGSDVSGEQVVELPLNQRNVFSLVNLDSTVNNSQQYQVNNSPGAQGNVDQDVVFFNFGGARMGTSAFLLDGHWDAAADWGGILYVPSVDELAEFKIQSSAFSPQYGWSMGNVVNAISKGGTRDFHGDAFEFLRNDKLDANNFFNNLEGLARPGFHRNQFGFTAGGPVYIPGIYRQRDKTFFFGDYEGLREQSPTTLLTTVPTALQRKGDFSQTHNADGTLDVIYNPYSTQLVGGQYVRTAYANNLITNLDSVALKLLSYYPQPTIPGDPVTGANNYAATAGLPLGSDQYTVKIDHNITDKQHLFGRWSWKHEYKQLAGDFYGINDVGGPGTLAPDNRWDTGFGYSNAFSPNLVMVLNLGWNRWTEGRLPQGSPFDVSTLGLPATLNTYGSPTGAFPAISVTGEGSLGSGVIQGWPREDRTISLDFTKIMGAHHTLSFGYMWVMLLINPYEGSQATFSFSSDFTQGPNPVAANQDSGNALASFLTGAADSGSITDNAASAISKKYQGFYLNDDWKITKKLTLNLGLRYEVQIAPTERHNKLPYFDPAATNPLSHQAGINLPGELVFTGGGNPRGIYDTPYSGFGPFAPRIGLSYSLNPKLVLRSGFGIFDVPSMMTAYEEGLAAQGFTQTTTYVGTYDSVTPANTLSNAFKSGLQQPTGTSLGGATYDGQTVNAVLRHRPSSYVEMWTANAQYQTVANIVLEARYVGNHGVKLPFGALFELNELPPSDLSLGTALLAQVPNPFSGIIQSGALAGPTVAYGQLLRPYPEYTGVESVQPHVASSWYHSLTISATKRFTSGLQFLANYTWSKYLSNSDSSGFSISLANYDVQNWYNIKAEKSYASDDIPQSLVLSYTYELPIGQGKKLAPKNKFLNAAIGGWQISGISTFKDGFPLALMDAVNDSYSFGGGQRPNLVGNPVVAHPTYKEWFNPAAFAEPAPFTFGNTPPTLGRVRAPGTLNTDATLQKNWGLWNKTSRLQFRLEAYNAFNHVQFYAPGFGSNAYLLSPTFGTLNAALPARSVQLGLKLYW